MLWGWFILAALTAWLLWWAMWPKPTPPTEADGLEALARAVDKAREANRE